MIKSLLKECGATGKTPNITVGTVETIAHDKIARVEITGNRENPVLNFFIPRGKDGAKLILRESFNGDIEIINNLSEIPNEATDTDNKKVLGINGIKELLEQISNNKNNIESITQLLESKINEINYNKNSINDINNIIDELQNSIDTNSRDIEILKSSVTGGGDISSESIFLLNNKIEDNKKQIEIIKQLAESNQTEINILKRPNEEGSIELELLSKLEQKIDTNKQELDNLKETVDSFNDSMNTIIDNYDSLKETVDSNKREILKLKGQANGSSGTGSGSSGSFDDITNSYDFEELKEEVQNNKRNIALNSKVCENNKNSIETLEGKVDEHTKDINRLLAGGGISPSPDFDSSDIASQLRSTKEELEKVKKVNQDLQEELNSFCIYYEHEGTDIKEYSTASKIKVHSIQGVTESTPSPTSSNSDNKKLDSVGDKENMVILFAQNKNLFNIGDRYENINSASSIVKQVNSQIEINTTSYSHTNKIYYYIDVKPNTSYTISGNMEKGDITLYSDRVKTSDSATQIKNIYSSTDLKQGVQFTTKSHKLLTVCLSNAGNIGQIVFNKIQIEEGSDKTDYIEHKEQRINIPLEESIKSLPHAGYDEIQLKEDGYFYLIRRIKKIDINDKLQIEQNWLTDSQAQYKVHLPRDVEVHYHSNKSTNIHVNTKPVKEQNVGTNNVYCSSNSFIFNFSKEMNTVDLFKNWLKENPTTIYYWNKEEEVSLIDTNINLRAFSELTHLTTKNETKAKLKVSLSRSISKIIKELSK